MTLIVIEGTDGSGKGTLTRMIVEKLREDGHAVETLSFPTYGTPSCKPVEMYLNGEFGSVGPYMAAMLYAFNRAKEMPVLEEGTVYVVNRYASANAGHQGGKIKDKGERDRFLDWLFTLEFDLLKLPRPDLTILIGMPASIGQQFVARKRPEERAYLTGGKTKDVHEADLHHLEDAERAFRYAARREGWTVVECAKDLPEDALKDPDTPPEEKVRPLEDIRDEILGIAEPLLRPIHQRRKNL